MRRIRRHLTYANVMATIAVFLVLSGGTAVALSGSNTVFSDDIVNNQVQSVDVRDDTLSSGGLGAFDLKPNSVGGSEVRNGSLTPTDYTGASILKAGVKSAEVSTTSPQYVDLGGPSVSVNVPNGALVALFVVSDIKTSNTCGQGAIRVVETTLDELDWGVDDRTIVNFGANYATTYSHGREGSSSPITNGAYAGYVNVYPATPGNRTYALRYSSPSSPECPAPAFFRNRKLWVQVIRPSP
jgi:hypothetical protein